MHRNAQRLITNRLHFVSVMAEYTDKLSIQLHVNNRPLQITIERAKEKNYRDQSISCHFSPPVTGEIRVDRLDRFGLPGH